MMVVADFASRFSPSDAQLALHLLRQRRSVFVLLQIWCFSLFASRCRPHVAGSIFAPCPRVARNGLLSGRGTTYRSVFELPKRANIGTDEFSTCRIPHLSSSPACPPPPACTPSARRWFENAHRDILGSLFTALAIS